MTSGSNLPTRFALRARWVAPMDRPLIDDGAVLLKDGRVTEVGPWRDVRRRIPGGMAAEDFGDAVILPGLINAHVHLELSDLTTPPPGGAAPRLADWLAEVFRRGPAPTPEGEQRVAAATAAGLRQCLAFGVTTVGDITRFPHVTRPLLARSQLRAVSFGEVTAMASRRHLLEPRVAAAMAPAPGADVVAAVSPHAPYSIEPAGIEFCLQATRLAGVPVAIHLAESQDEAPFLASHAGPFKELWRRIGGWDAAVPTVPGGPIELARATGLLDYERTLLVHVNYVTDAELQAIAAGRASVAFCPRTHALFGHPPHRWRDMLAAGVNVCIGTDSTASSPDLNLVEDLRLLHRQSPEVPSGQLWKLATTFAADALGLSDVGRIAAGSRGNIAVFPAAGADPLRDVLEAGVLPRKVFVAGRGSAA